MTATDKRFNDTNAMACSDMIAEYFGGSTRSRKRTQ